MTYTLEIQGIQGIAGPPGAAVAIDANTVLGNPTGVTANPIPITYAQLNTALDVQGQIEDWDIALAQLPAEVVRTDLSYTNPNFLVSIPFTKVTGVATKLQQHAQTAYYDAAGTFTLAQTFANTVKISKGDANADSYSTRVDSLVFSRGDLPTSYLNKITNSFSATPGNTTMNFELGDGSGSGYVVPLTLLGSGVVSAATEFRLAGNSYSRVADADSAGGWGGGYNFNLNSDTPQRDSTGAVSAIRFLVDGNVHLFAEASGSPGAISPRYSFGPTGATFNGTLSVINPTYSSLPFVVGVDSSARANATFNGYTVFRSEGHTTRIAGNTTWVEAGNTNVSIGVYGSSYVDLTENLVTFNKPATFNGTGTFGGTVAVNVAGGSTDYELVRLGNTTNGPDVGMRIGFHDDSLGSFWGKPTGAITVRRDGSGAPGILQLITRDSESTESAKLTLSQYGATFNGPVVSDAANTSNSNAKFGSIELQTYSLNDAWIGENVYFNGSSFVRRSTGYGSQIYFRPREILFRSLDTDAAGTFNNGTQFKIFSNGTIASGSSIDASSESLTGANFIVTGSGAATFNSHVYVRGDVFSQISGEGSAAIRNGGPANTGYFQMSKPNGIRQGYIGSDAGNDISFTNEQSGIFAFNKGASFTGNIVQDVGAGSNTIYQLGTASSNVAYMTIGGGGSIARWADGHTYINGVSSPVGTQLVLFSNNAIAIGTNTTPTTKFHVEGTSKFTDAATFNGTITNTTGGAYSYLAAYGSFIGSVNSAGSNNLMVGRSVDDSTYLIGRHINLCYGDDGANVGLRITNTGAATFNGTVTSTFSSSTSDLSTLDLTDGQTRLHKNTSSGNLKLFANDGGSIKSVTLT